MNSKYHYLVTFLLMGLYQGASEATSCTQIGRFPNDENNDCRGYVMCLKGGITDFTEYNITCPLGSIYSHIEQQCTNATNYKCYPNFNCTASGNFVDPESKNCSSFIACVEGIKNIATARLVQCPENTVFDSAVKECIDNKLYLCNTTTTASTPADVVPQATFVNINVRHGSNSAMSSIVSCISINIVMLNIFVF